MTSLVIKTVIIIVAAMIIVVIVIIAIVVSTVVRVVDGRKAQLWRQHSYCDNHSDDTLIVNFQLTTVQDLN